MNMGDRNRNVLDRSLLGFQEAVKEYFEFIETQNGYKQISSDPCCVKFKSDTTYLNIYHERISYEIYFEIGILPEGNMNSLKADIRDIVLYTANPSDQSFYQASNKNAVEVVVKVLANLIDSYAKDALSGSVNYLKSVSVKRAQKQQQALILEELRVNEEKAKLAWSSKDYSAVKEAYEKYEQYLDSVQLKRLQYGRKMLSDNTKQ